MTSGVLTNKADLRGQAHQVLREVDTMVRCAAGRKVWESVVAHPAFAAARTVGMYVALGREISLAALMQMAWMHGKTVCVPCRGEADASYVWGVLKDGADLVKGPDGVPQPSEYDSVPAEQIDLVLVPGLAFSKKGVRLGRGGGFYDRLLADMRGVKMGVAFDAQIFEELPVEAHDIHMDFVVSEKEVLNIENNTETMRRN